MANLGIDLGTSNTVAAWAMGPEKVTLLRFRTSTGLDGSSLPSVVRLPSAPGDVCLVGRFAELGRGDGTLCRCFKRHLGGLETASRHQGILASAKLLREVRQEYLKAVMLPDRGQEIDAVVTIPASNLGGASRDVRIAAELAGLRIRFQSEPVAAAHHHRRQKRLDGARGVVVIDLGGGTFDVSVLDADGDRFDVLANESDLQLGGEDFTRKIQDILGRGELSRLENQADPSVREKLRELAERIKIELSTKPMFRQLVEIGGIRTEVALSRLRFEEECRGLMGALEDGLEGVIHRVSASHPRLEMTHVVLVGGGGHVPMIRAHIQQYFRRRSQEPRILTDDLETAVAFGAASLALEDQTAFQVSDAEYCLLVARGGRLVPYPLVPLNQPLPCVVDIPPARRGAAPESREVWIQICRKVQGGEFEYGPGLEIGADVPELRFEMDGRLTMRLRFGQEVRELGSMDGGALPDDDETAGLMRRYTSMVDLEYGKDFA